MRCNWIFICVWMLLCTRLAFAKHALIKALRLSSATQRLVLDVSRECHYRAFTLADPNRLVIDVLNARLEQAMPLPKFEGTPIIRLRTGIQRGKDVRLVFDLHMPIHIHDFMLTSRNLAKLQANKPQNRLVIDWSAQADLSRSQIVLTQKQHRTQLTQANTTIAKKNTQKKLRAMVIVLDPGHGGKDPGAMGPRGIQEKKIVLNIAKYVKENLERYYGVQVHLTRDSDRYVPLRDRLHFARIGAADLFISIHADAYLEGHSRGVSVYALSQSGASSEVAHWLSDRDNYSELGGVDLNDLQDSSEMLRTMLLDLSQTLTIASSIRLGEHLLKKLGRVVPLHKSHVEQAPFVVLKSPDIPSLLVETGFLSNLREEQQLGNRRHQYRLAQAISAGIFSYAKQYAPKDTFFAARYQPVLRQFASKHQL